MNLSKRNGMRKMSNKVVRHKDIISQEVRSKISKRYKRVTKAVNEKFWNSNSETSHSFYVGSYGRNTATSSSDIDILIEVPQHEYERYDSLSGNGQSRLLQAIKSSIIKAYPRSEVRADGQIIKINFTDGIKFEILPAFKEEDIFGNVTYTYPDSNMGGNWKSTNPKAEQRSIYEKNKSSNQLLVATCRHMRIIKNKYYSSYKLSGIFIDSFVYNAIGNWKFVEKGSGNMDISYEKILLNYFDDNLFIFRSNFVAPGSNQRLEVEESLDCMRKVLLKMND